MFQELEKQSIKMCILDSWTLWWSDNNRSPNRKRRHESTSSFPRRVDTETLVAIPREETIKLVWIETRQYPLRARPHQWLLQLLIQMPCPAFLMNKLVNRFEYYDFWKKSWSREKFEPPPQSGDIIQSPLSLHVHPPRELNCIVAFAPNMFGKAYLVCALILLLVIECPKKQKRQKPRWKSPRKAVYISATSVVVRLSVRHLVVVLSFAATR